MNELVYDSIVEILAIVFSALGSVILTGVGLLVEHQSMQNIVAGHSTIGYWEMYMGVLALFAGVYLLGYRQCWSRLLEFHHE